MANSRPAGRMWPSKLFNAALVQSLKIRYFGTKSIRSLEKVQFLALKVTIFFKCGPRAVLGWPWLLLGMSLNHVTIFYYILPTWKFSILLSLPQSIIHEPPPKNIHQICQKFIDFYQLKCH
jgi:hypothetical protein